VEPARDAVALSAVLVGVSGVFFARALRRDRVLTR
jgi:hypothetical protein